MLRKIQNNPSLSLQNGVIQKIGEAYLAKHGEQPGNFFSRLCHNNHDLAKRLRNYHNSSVAYEDWCFLAEIYGELPNNNGEIAKQVLDLFSKSFNVDINIHYSNSSGKFPIQLTYSTSFISRLLLEIAGAYYQKMYARETKNKYPHVRFI